MKNLLITFVFVLISGVFTYAGNPVKKASKKTEAVESKEEVAITEFCTITHCRYRLVVRQLNKNLIQDSSKIIFKESKNETNRILPKKNRRFY
ncbi:hypothetical protein J2Q11_03595 [Tenacibaculum finnmarkense genomovar finnmarkense]|uniref:hypothetical protein n=1 Tax=Tenacibaculum finnmarkense TaxID=2781243 RepID=UPI001E4CBE59|nr:hypothetical protein [Tenacibaculum finnmarkense]MCD8418496.1 hypothetical protein [Tenacibaculum finnmarkense genomovar finnmarkense]MCG8185155.1 hypothetical protein [Tenacibaculum finnmarkense genomovar finnmarkense]MCG8201012.1 hypothetical protein [Tenacibaculum finnmarkense genomovar finnmarkense]MCG8209114.1 hypothetical protein [Tenacibaculum finnmarkense genomovar finnmarkense]MCG8211571.1 hypothetical protein [Tenacibaculum finnmarkense genomovar finnmarkense]